MSYWSFPGKTRSVCFNEKRNIVQYFRLIFQEENHNILLLLRIFLSIPEFLICWVLWSKVTVTLKIGSGLRPLMKEIIKKNSYDMTMYAATIYLMLIKPFFVFSFGTTCIVYIGKLCERSTLTHIYWREDILSIRIEKKISRDQMYSCKIECSFCC